MAPSTSFTYSAYDVSYPPLDGSLYFPEMVEFNASHNPTHTLYTFRDARVDDLCHISHLEFYRACQRVAHAIRPERQGLDNNVVAIIANCDTILYHALTMGIIYAGHIPFPMSPRNSPAAAVNMMRKTGCRRVIASHSQGPLLDGIRTEFGSEKVEIEIREPPALAYAFPKLGKETTSMPFEPYPKADKRPVDDATMYYLHSSGSTGFPKPIPITYLTSIHWCITPPVLEHLDFPTDIRIGAVSLPPFHTLGMCVQLFYPIASLKSVCLFAPTSFEDPTTPPVFANAQNTIDALKRTKATSLVVVPAFVEEWATSPDLVEYLGRLQYVVVSGGPLAKKTGDELVAAGVRLSSLYGTTEVCALTYVFRAPAERTLWDWIRFGPNQRIRWVDQGDGTYECQILTCPTHQVSVENLPDVKGYATSDVFVKHPTVEGLYQLVGRLDDVLVHASGEKTVPMPMETLIGSSPYVAGVCMFGRGRNQTGVLVEPRAEFAIDVSSDAELAAYRNKIWGEVQEANKGAPAHSRIFKEMILVTSKEKPMMRAGKGTVIKKGTMALYASEIDALYESVETSAKAGLNVPLPGTWTQSEVETWLMAHVTAINGDVPIEVEKDVFEQGFDSLSSTLFKNRVIGSFAASDRDTMRAVASKIGQDVIFANPTIRVLAGHLIRLVTGEDAAPLDPRAEIEAMISKYAVGLENPVSGKAKHGSDVVLLTGSTGGLGSYLLASLLSRGDVAVVYAFNRPSKTSTIQQRQRAAFEDRGLDTTLLDSKMLIYIEGDAAQPHLSLDDQTYDQICSSLTVIVHNAWRLDFNLGLSSFEPHVRATRHLIDLARVSNGARFMFTSSIASAQGWDKRKGPVPEEVPLDAGVAVGPGYGASKYVSDRILTVSGLPATSFRIGQITGGAPRGAWSTTDWVPILVKTSLALGALPLARGVISWIPPDTVSDTILDVAFSDGVPPRAVNVVHPRPIAWERVMAWIGDVLYRRDVTPTRLEMIPFGDWVVRLEAYEADARRVPAIKMIGFVKSLAHEEGDEVGGFPSFVVGNKRAVEAVSEGDVERWVEYWMAMGMFA